MAYQTYITEAIVCGSRDHNTADKQFLLFTREGGMVWARARSVRKEHSKQRYALQDFSYVRASLVSGKGGWQIAGVEPGGNAFYDASTRESRGFIRNITRLLRRTMQGETPDRELYDDIYDSFRRANEHDSNRFEQVLSYRILHRLGYVAPEGGHSRFLKTKRAYEGVAHCTNDEQKMCQKEIEQALLESHL